MSKEYIKGSFAGKTFPIIAGKSVCKEGTCYIHLDTLSENSNTVRFFMQTFDGKRNETGSIKMLLTQETAKQIGDELSNTLFDSNYKIKLTCPKCGAEGIKDIT